MIEIPASFRAVAESKRVIDPDREWRQFMKKNGETIPENAEYRWTLWLATAPKRKDEPAPPTEQGETREQARQRQVQLEIKEAKRLDPDRSHALAACKQIVANLETGRFVNRAGHPSRLAQAHDAMADVDEAGCFDDLDLEP